MPPAPLLLTTSVPIRVLLIVLMVVVAACGPADSGSGGGQPSQGSEPSPAGEEGQAGEPTPGTTLTACQIVTAADVASALTLDPGAVAEGTLDRHGTVLDAAANECTYEDDSWGGLIVNVTPTDGVNTFDALVSAYGDEAEAVAGMGDGALWFEDDDRGYFIKGSVLFFLQFTFLVDPVPLREPTLAIGAAGLARL